MQVSRNAVLISSLPGGVMLCLFYSLALHMHQNFGGWPPSIGFQGFSSFLEAHASLTIFYFYVLMLFNFFVLPWAMLVCLLRPNAGRFVPYLALYAFVFGVCWGLMQLAPEPFLYWWRD